MMIIRDFIPIGALVGAVGFAMWFVFWIDGSNKKFALNQKETAIECIESGYTPRVCFNITPGCYSKAIMLIEGTDYETDVDNSGQFPSGG